jgi:two-component system sensor histidine kinase KdpD
MSDRPEAESSPPSGAERRRVPRPAADPGDFLELVRRQERGKLKLYIGSAAGVGKTYRMINEAHELRRRGVDVVIGFVETHGRAETASQLGELEVVPRQQIVYRGVTLEEMDVDG